MQNLLVVLELFIAVALVVCVLLQRSEGGALGMGGGGAGLGGLFSPRGAADTLTRTTTILAVLFFLVCTGLVVMSLHGRNEKSILETSSPAAAPILPKTITPAGPKVPLPH
jgi:preprotein translocase subunit SecG